MKEMIKKIREEKGGFTLAELLIVVAIVLVLVAIAVPVFTGALDKANEAVKAADIRAVKAVAATEIILEKGPENLKSGKWTATATVDENGNVGQVTIAEWKEGDKDDAVPVNGDKGYTVTAVVSSSDVTPAA
ncbi:prepilin-type N-terminal cleavage/methylation domain-containing protein [Paraeggerthella sp. Marseille-Q4926]|uniref:prepilin-type N-terminal cleavage/methylation domain-containing protein n=1 Tax=unclassified Paraeggerthella TaxID=2641972 RepID=UPI001CE499A8|nr:prepilin-type N-terminal cleavage/methylation domain-containing protein [Paraeggerthella sp. Marseille-Q4926]MDY3981244.1 prepilin-type N-terminal cleavage/methylation domain-containing protein [Paraeggerthella sp.]